MSTCDIHRPFNALSRLKSSKVKILLTFVLMKDEWWSILTFPSLWEQGYNTCGVQDGVRSQVAKEEFGKPEHLGKRTNMEQPSATLKRKQLTAMEHSMSPRKSRARCIPANESMCFLILHTWSMNVPSTEPAQGKYSPFSSLHVYTVCSNSCEPHSNTGLQIL